MDAHPTLSFLLSIGSEHSRERPCFLGLGMHGSRFKSCFCSILPLSWFRSMG